mgnify:CR=1 FL=1
MSSQALLLKYSGTQVVPTDLTGDFKTDRIKIFGKGGFIRDKPLVKALMMLCGYLKAEAYVTPDETFQDQIVPIYDGRKSRFWFIQWCSALMARVTNYFQALLGVRDEDRDAIKQDIDAIIDEFLSRRNPRYDVKLTITFDDTTPAYTVELEVYMA